MISTDMFPYETFPIRLEFGEKKQTTICWFECQEHLDKYLNRHKLDKKTIKIDYRDEKPPVRSKKHKRNVDQKSESKNNRSSGAVRNRKSSVDSIGNTTRTTKRKK